MFALCSPTISGLVKSSVGGAMTCGDFATPPPECLPIDLEMAGPARLGERQSVVSQHTTCIALPGIANLG
jgi:hypothetical protein